MSSVVFCFYIFLYFLYIERDRERDVCTCFFYYCIIFFIYTWIYISMFSIYSLFLYLSFYSLLSLCLYLPPPQSLLSLSLFSLSSFFSMHTQTTCHDSTIQVHKCNMGPALLGYKRYTNGTQTVHKDELHDCFYIFV